MEPSRSLRDTLLQLLSRVSRAIGLRASQSNSTAHDSGEETEEAQEDDDEEDYAMLSDDETAYNVGSFTVVPTNQCDIATLQR